MTKLTPGSCLDSFRKLLSNEITRLSCLMASMRLSSTVSLGDRKGSLWFLYSFPLEMFDASAREYVLQSGDAHTNRISDGSNPSSLQIVVIISPVGYSDKSRFRNTEVVCMLQIAESGACDVSAVNVRALSLDFSRAVSL